MVLGGSLYIFVLLAPTCRQCWVTHRRFIRKIVSLSKRADSGAGSGLPEASNVAVAAAAAARIISLKVSFLNSFALMEQAGREQAGSPGWP